MSCGSVNFGVLAQAGGQMSLAMHAVMLLGGRLNTSITHSWASYDAYAYDTWQKAGHSLVEPRPL